MGCIRFECLFCIVIAGMAIPPAAAEQSGQGGTWQRDKNPEAVAEVLAGKRKVANAAWWGFDEQDSTRFLQAAIDSGAEKVIVSNMGADWVITPITLADDQEIFFEPGVVIAAKPGAFHGPHDSLFNAMDKKNITIGGYGATLKMQKNDYMNPDLYEKAEWRSAILLNGVSHIKIYGLTIRDTGGDGIDLGDWGKGYSDNVSIRDMVFDNNYRQGISVISAENLLIENCILKNTSGTGPASGIDLEPNNPNCRLINIVIRNCVAENNDGEGFIVAPAQLSSESEDISVIVENCYVKSSKGHGIQVSSVKDDGPKGFVEFRNCHVENVQGHGLRILDKSSANAEFRFVNCTFKNVAASPSPDTSYEGVERLPIIIHLRGLSWSTRPGGLEFVDCVVEDDRNRPAMAYRATFENAPALYNVKGNITVKNPHGARVDLGSKLNNVNLNINE